MLSLLKNKTLLILLSLIILGSFLRFYNLNWGAPYYFHPDERNIASSVSQLQFPENMNPHFFAYGSLPIYAIFFTGLPLSFLTTCHTTLFTCRVGFEDALIIGRAYSAFFSVLLIPLSFFIGKKMLSKNTGLLSATLITFSTGLIQFAHFATFELWTTLFSTLLLFFCMQLVEKVDKKIILWIAVVSGILVATKATNLLLLPLPFIALAITFLKTRKKSGEKKTLFLKFFAAVLFVVIGIVVIFLLTNPYVFLTKKDFLGSMDYESGVALGTIPVFYTGEFYQTTPLLFQFVKVFPFLLNPLLTLLGLFSFFYGLFLFIKLRSAKLFLLLFTLSVLLFPQAFFFVKWTRYMLPTIPFFIILICFFLTGLNLKKRYKIFTNVFIALTVIATFVFGSSYFITAFVEKDTRIASALTASRMFPVTTPFLSEMYDMGIVAFNEHFPHITLFNFYDLDASSSEFNKQALINQLPSYQYLILPSQRVLATRLGHKTKFPQGYTFYKELTMNKHRFQKVYETPCDIFCQITYLGDQVFRFEGTANSFERPPLQIYRIRDNEE